MKKHKVILDCDNTMGMPNWEVDDGLLLLYLLGRDDFDLLGITTTFGNSSHTNVAHYTQALLQELGREDIPCFDGETYQGQNPLINKDRASGIRYTNEIQQKDEITPAARFLAEMVKKNPGEITILAAGPVSNVYKASLVDPEFYRNVKEIIVMGGYIGDLFLGGRMLGELNFSCDPTATYHTIHSGAKITIMTGQVCLDAPFTEKDFLRLPAWPSIRITTIRNWLATFTKAFSNDAFYLWDLLLPVYVSYPELFDNKLTWINPSKEDLKSGFLPITSKGVGSEVTMPTQILDQAKFMDILFSAWNKQSEKESMEAR